MSISKKIGGAKNPNLFPIVTRDDAKKLLSSVIIAKRIIVSKVSEFYDPIGLFEPVKLQLKLEMKKLTNLHWDEKVPDTEQGKWKTLEGRVV